MDEQNVDSLNFLHRIILQLVPEGSTVLDLGCGNGSLLKTLCKTKNAKGRGVEFDEDMVVECLKKGLSVFHGNIEEGLKDYPDNSYDYVILNQTLQSVYHTELILKEMLRVGRFVIIGIPNFAHWRVRLSIFFKGVIPKIQNLNYEWYNTPNIRLITIKDFMNICSRMSIRIAKRFFSSREKPLRYYARLFSNLLSENALFVLEKETEKNLKEY